MLFDLKILQVKRCISFNTPNLLRGLPKGLCVESMVASLWLFSGGGRSFKKVLEEGSWSLGVALEGDIGTPDLPCLFLIPGCSDGKSLPCHHTFHCDVCLTTDAKAMR